MGSQSVGHNWVAKLKTKIWVYPGTGEGYGNPVQYSCLKTPVNRGASWAPVPRATKSQTQLKQFSTHAWSWVCPGVYLTVWFQVQHPIIHSVCLFIQYSGIMVETPRLVRHWEHCTKIKAGGGGTAIFGVRILGKKLQFERYAGGNTKMFRTGRERGMIVRSLCNWKNLLWENTRDLPHPTLG